MSQASSSSQAESPPVSQAQSPQAPSPSVGDSTADLDAPLYIAWQLTNECNLACLHCIEESGPGKAFADELDRTQIFAILAQCTSLQVPYLSLSGGEPMLHPLFFEMSAYLCASGTQLKIETNAHCLDAARCERLAELGVKAVQVSLDGATAATYNRMRARGDFAQALAGIRLLRSAGVPVEINFSPTRFNVHEIEAVIDLASELGAYSFYTGRTMYTGNAVKTWHLLAPSEEQYRSFFAALHAKSAQYRGRMRVYFHEQGLLEELRYRLRHPAALLIVLPNGLVKLINALPFVCGDLRHQSLTEVWSHFRRAWADQRVAQFVEQLAADPRRTAALHRWVYL
ncbi:MAG TPA: radical SAM protein [Steroidobacteraceae bacterium]|nr:radical SAM protein [Steroidobacteraceae bacterium]